MIRAVDIGVLPVSTLPKLISERREPEQDDFRPRTTWSFFNAITEPRQIREWHRLAQLHQTH